MQDECPKHNLTEVVLPSGTNIIIRNDGSISCNEEILFWCNEMIHGTWAYDIHIKGFRARIQDRYIITFSFRESQDALLFKLTWG